MGSIIQGTSDIVMLILLFGLAIFVHELGHFLAAVKLGFVVDTFSLGFGPAIWKRKIRGITYKIAWIPLGGYVSLPQLDPSGMASIQGRTEQDKTPDDSSPQPLPFISPWKKIVVVVAGPLGNLALAVVLAFVIFFYPGATTPPERLIVDTDEDTVAYAGGVRTGDEVLKINGRNVDSYYQFTRECSLMGDSVSNVVLTVKSKKGTFEVTVPLAKMGMNLKTAEGISIRAPWIVAAVAEGESAQKAGVVRGDAIVEFDGEPVQEFESFVKQVRARRDKTVKMVVRRKTELLTLEVTPALHPKLNKVVIGIVPDSARSPYFWMQHRNPWQQIANDFGEVVRILEALFTPKHSAQALKGMGGLPEISVALWFAMKASFVNGIGFLRFLCVNLAILNLLPIPVLDGGHVMFALWEGVTRRKLNARFVNGLVNFFAVLLIGLLLFINLRGVVRLPKMLKLMRGNEAAEKSGTVSFDNVPVSTNKP